MQEYVILVDGQDSEVGTMAKLQAHEEGRLHRAISVFIFNSAGEMLLQQRAWGKYHSGGLWSNTCCSHPRPGEYTAEAATRRLYEEMGLECELTPAFSFVYRAEFDNGLTEHEFDHVFTGVTDVFPAPDENEVAGWKYMDEQSLLREMEKSPSEFTEWFKLCLQQWRRQLFPKK